MEPDLKYFEDLKKEIASTFRNTHPHCKAAIEEWKGQDIVDFQEELISKVHGRISEKWFYTHIKAPATKLPRIDMLNMLSEYAGYKNWNDFIGSKQISQISKDHIPENDDVNEPLSDTAALEKNKGVSKRTKYLLLSGTIVLFLIIVFKISLSGDHIYKCCFVDIDGNTPLTTRVRITILKDGESPVYAETTSGCLELVEKSDKIKFVIATPYFKPDTFIRGLSNEITQDRIQLKSDDYSLMIHYFSTSNIKDWERRRLQLKEMFADNAKIFQVFSGNAGMELYNKEEFINKMTMPLKSLKNIQIWDVRYHDKKIIELRFSQSGNNE